MAKNLERAKSDAKLKYIVDSLLTRIAELQQDPAGSEQIVTVSAAALSPEHGSPSHGQQLNFSCRIWTNERYKRGTCLIDSGASAEGFIDDGFVKAYRIPCVPLQRKTTLRLADGKPVEQLTHMAKVRFGLDNHVTEAWCFVAKLDPKQQLILGMPWIQLHDPTTSWSKRTLTFQSTFCLTNCCNGAPVSVISPGHKQHQAGCSWPNEEPIPSPKADPPDIYAISALAFSKTASKNDHEVVVMEQADFDQLAQDPSTDQPIIAAAQVRHSNPTKAITPEDYELFERKMRKPPPSLEEIRQRVKSEHHQWLHVFNPRLANRLPPNRPGIDHNIDLTPGHAPPAKKVYGLSREQARAVKDYIDDMLSKGYIRPSNSPYAAPVLIVKKPGGGLRICIDYRGLNEITIKNRNAPPLIRETLARLASAGWYTKLDVIAAFNEIRIKTGDEHKTAFVTRYGQYEYVVMPFGLCNAPGTFQTFINETLRPYLDVFCTAYLDDILVYSNTFEEHIEHVNKVLQALSKANIFLDINKCEFHNQRVKYLGLIVSTEGIQMDEEKVSAIRSWPKPRGVKDVQAFLGFANFYRRFIAGFSRLAAPLTNLTKTTTADRPPVFPWPDDSEENKSFEALKTAFTTAPILAHFDPDKETWVETDASDYVVAAVLSQPDQHGLLHPVAFLSKKMSPAECNYEIYDKELLAIVRAFEEWEPELAGTKDPIKVISDHKNLEFFMTTKRLNRRQARWAEFLAEFNFKITYRPGKQGTKPDALTRRPGDIPDHIEDPRVQHQQQILLGEDHFDHRLTHQFHSDAESTLHALYLAEQLSNEFCVTDIASMLYDLSEEHSGDEATGQPDPQATPVDLMDQIKEAYEQDDILQQVMAAKLANKRRIPDNALRAGFKVEMSELAIRNDMLWKEGKLVIPKDDHLRTEIVRHFHDHPVMGHAGRNEVYHRVLREFFWPKMYDTVARFVNACQTCRQCKPYQDGKHGLLKPLPIPEKYWTDITVDFITKLPECKRHNRKFSNIMVVVDRLSKKKRFIPMETIDAPAVAEAFLVHIWREEGFPEKLVSDRGSQFVGHFWQQLCNKLGIHPKLSTGFHPETDGQTENANKVLKQYLRAYVSHNQNDWVDFLHLAEFEANSRISQSTKMTPFEATKGYLPRSGLELSTTPWTTQPLNAQAKSDIAKANEIVHRIDQLREALRQQLEWAQALQIEQADRKRWPAPEIRIGDRVMIDTRNFKSNRPNKSLDFKNIGPFTVSRIIDNGMAVEVDLPERYQMHNVFHIWLIHPFDAEPLPGQAVAEPPPEVTYEDGSAEYEVEEILDSKIDKRRLDYDPRVREEKGERQKKGCLRYLVKWMGYTEPEWTDWPNLNGAAQAVKDFHQKNPGKPGPHPTFNKESKDWEPLKIPKGTETQPHS